MAKDIIQALQDGVVYIKYRSLKSGNEKEIEATLKSDLIPNNFKINQNDSSDKLIMYLVEFERWEDIEKDTILEWRVME